MSDHELEEVRASVQAVLDYLDGERLVQKLERLEELLAATVEARVEYAAARDCSLPDLRNLQSESETDVNRAIAAFFPTGITSPIPTLKRLPEKLQEFLRQIAPSQAAA